MSWQEDYHKFDAFFHQFERDLDKKNLSREDEQSLVDNLNQVVEWGWKALQHYDTAVNKSGENQETEGEAFSGNHALIRLKDLFEKKIQIRSGHDVEYLQQNEWEIRAVVHPAFHELREFFQSINKAEAAE